jgi:MoaA/NifB/PqqE/SkfB family radical SAM enzyme
MLTKVHILLTYACTFRCDHCFVFASPQAPGKFTPARVTHLLEQILAVKSVEWIIFEGGEPFLVYPLLLTSVKRARQLGFKVGVITNGYFGRSAEAAARYLRPLAQLGLDRIIISNDRYHYKNTNDSPAHVDQRCDQIRSSNNQTNDRESISSTHNIDPENVNFSGRNSSVIAGSVEQTRK